MKRKIYCNLRIQNRFYSNRRTLQNPNILPSKDIENAAGQLSTNIEAIHIGAKLERYSLIFSIPEYSPICCKELNKKNILKTHKSITLRPVFNTAVYEFRNRPISFLYRAKNTDVLLLEFLLSEYLVVVLARVLSNPYFNETILANI